jgi:hypothetical protein
LDKLLILRFELVSEGFDIASLFDLRWGFWSGKLLKDLFYGWRVLGNHLRDDAEKSVLLVVLFYGGL